tara:strand:- start:664 stop:861 length:198 start_codon:yes stop_codon:yes gene_type:complete
MIKNLKRRLLKAKKLYLANGGKMAQLLNEMQISSDLWRRMFSHGEQPKQARTINAINGYFEKNGI